MQYLHCVVHVFHIQHVQYVHVPIGISMSSSKHYFSVMSNVITNLDILSLKPPNSTYSSVA